MSTQPLLTIGIPSYKGLKELKVLLTSIQDQLQSLSIEVIVVDDGSNDGTVDMMRNDFPMYTIIGLPENRGIARATQHIIDLMHGEYLLRLDADTIVNTLAVQSLIDFLESHKDAGVVVPRLVDQQNAFQPSYESHLKAPLEWFEDYALWFKKLKSRLHQPHTTASNEPFRIAYAASAAMMVRKEAVQQVGGLDPQMEFFMEDADWILRIANAGWEIWYLPTVSIVHIGGQSGTLYIHTRDRSLKNLYYFYQKHKPGAFNQVMLATAILIGSAVSLFAAVVSVPLLLWKQKTRLVLMRSLRSFFNVFIWHFYTRYKATQAG